jgi:hypothetical protein
MSMRPVGMAAWRSCNNAMEEWRNIIGYENKYQISNLGQVRSLPWIRRPHLLILRTVPDRHGYPTIDLYLNGKCKRYRVHILMIKAFKGETPEGMECRHLDDNKLNCTTENVIWGTRSQNLHDSYKNNPYLRIKLSISQTERRKRESDQRKNISL